MVSVVGCSMVSVVARNDLLWFPSLVVVMVSGCYRTAALSPMETIVMVFIKNNRKTSGRFCEELNMYMYIYIYIYIHMY